jgi:Zn-finger protein
VYTTRKNKKEQGRKSARHSYIATNNKIGLIITVSKGMNIKKCNCHIVKKKKKVKENEGSPLSHQEETR